jgi:hypothetical protein
MGIRELPDNIYQEKEKAEPVFDRYRKGGLPVTSG